MEGSIWLNTNIEGHIVNLFCLFGCFKNMWPFSLTLLSLIKNISVPFRKETFTSLMAWFFLPLKVFMISLWFYDYLLAIAMWYSSSTITAMFLRNAKVQSNKSSTSTSMIKSSFLKTYYQNLAMSTYFDSETWRTEVKVKC